MQAGSCGGDRGRTACLIWLITGTVPRAHTDVLLPRSEKKAGVASTRLMFSKVPFRQPVTLTITWADGESQPHPLQVRKLSLSVWWVCLRPCDFSGGMLEAIMVMQVSTGSSSLLMNALSIPPICLSPGQHFSPKDFPCFVYCILVKATPFRAFQEGHHGAEKQGKKLADPTGQE